jgi:hypothetical protein
MIAQLTSQSDYPNLDTKNISDVVLFIRIEAASSGSCGQLSDASSDRPCCSTNQTSILSISSSLDDSFCWRRKGIDNHLRQSYRDGSSNGGKVLPRSGSIGACKKPNV